MIYTCQKCLKTFSQKSNYNVHINRKFPCIEILDQTLDVNINNDITRFLTPKPAKIPPKNAKKRQITPKNAKNNIINKNETTIICEFCNKCFARKDNLVKHKKTRCKIKNNLDEENKKLKENILILENKLDLLENKQLCLSAKKKNKLIIPNISNIINTNNNMTNTNNGQIINNNISIKMVSFGDEDYNKLTEGEILNVLKSKNKAFFNLVKLIHLNERLPEYNNVLINNFKSNYGSIFNDSKMIVQNKKQIIAEIITNRLYDLKQLVIKYKQTKHLSKKEIEILGSVIAFLQTSYLEDEDIDGNIIKPDKETTKKIKELYDELMLMFYNDRDLVEQTLKQFTFNLEDKNNLYLDV
jgi:hypothetical protein